MSNANALLSDYQRMFHQATRISDERIVELSQLTALIMGCRAQGKSVYLVGNGGSAAIASHMSNDIANCLGIRSSGWSDTSMITCLANDHGYEQWVAKMVERDLVDGDLLIAISSSGNSQNILNGVEQAKQQGGSVVTLSGFSADNRLRQQGSLNLWVDSDNYNIVEGAHQFLIAAAIELGVQQLNKGEVNE